MGKAYQHEQRERVKALLEAGRDEESIEKETGVSDRTIRRWKLELERTGRIGKPPESRTGRHRVLSPEIEAALFVYVKDHPDATVDDMLWWLYDTYKIVVGTRTIRRVFERKGTNFKARTRQSISIDSLHDHDEDEDSSLIQPDHYQSPYAPMAQMTAQSGSDQTEVQLAQALGQQTPQQPTAAQALALERDLPEDEETIQLQLQQIALQKREIELKLRMRRIKQGKPATPSSKGTPPSMPSSLYKPGSQPESSAPKRDSRSKKKQEESKRKTAERQERMLRDLERRSRRREHLTAEWVQSKDIWPLRAQSILADLMHRYSCYAFSQQNVDTFEEMYRELYQLVDLSKSDWNPHVHDEMLRERMKRKMAQLRMKMIKTGEIVSRNDGYAGYQRAEDYTGEQAGNTIGDESEVATGDSFQAEPGALHGHQDPQLQHQDPQLQHQDPQLQHHDPQLQHQDSQLQYDPVPDTSASQLQHAGLPYGNTMMHHQGPPQYPMMPDQHHTNMLPYGQMGGGHEGGMSVL